MTKRFIATFDEHYGWERRHGRRYPIHDQLAWGAIMEFAKDFKPHTWVMGGDLIDCGAISHWNKGKPGLTEGMKLVQDVEGARREYLEPVERIARDLIYITGNHERFLSDLVEDLPALEGIIDLEPLLKLRRWRIIPQGGVTHLGRLWFAHGDQVKGGGEHVAKAGALHFNRSIRFGHYHTYQTFTATSAIDNEQPLTGTCVPCLCIKNPQYNEGRPNRWAQGFCWGYVREDGTFNDYISVIINGQFTALGRTYRG